MSCKCKVFAFNCCDQCCDTSGGVSAEVGKSPYIGENGNWFTWNGEEWEDTGVKAAGGGAPAELPWATGVIKDTSITINRNDPVTPIFQSGTASLISGNTFVAPVDGLYSLHMGGGSLPVSTSNWAHIVKNASEYSLPSVIMTLGGIVTPAVIPISLTIHLKANEYLCCLMGVGTTVSTINSGGATHKFTFAQIA